MKSILIISPEEWSSHAVSKHHYALTLAYLGHRVFFLDPPNPSLRCIKLRTLPDQPNLTVVQGPKVAPGLRFYPSPLRLWLETRWLVDFERAVGCVIDTVWLFENSRFFDLRFARNRLKIYHQVDLNQDFNPVTSARTADVCFCTSDLILARLLPHNQKVFKIHHGTAVPEQLLTLAPEQAAYFHNQITNVVYIGNLEMSYLDSELLARVAQNHPSICFHFVGGYTENSKIRKIASQLTNVVWWGKVSSNLIPTILERADVLLVTYQEKHWQDQSSPHKFMEYLASGKIIVATYTDEYKDKRHLLEMVDKSSDYPDALARVLGNLIFYNSPELQAQRKEFAMAHTYPRQLEAIFSILQQHGLSAPLEDKKPI